MPENSICHEIDTGKRFYLANGEWHQLPARGGEGLPADFPAEGSANANKFLGFDANGDYEAKNAPSGGGAGRFTVTFTESNGDITADKTIAEIVEAKEAGDIVVGVYTSFGVPCEIPCVSAFEMQIDGEAVPVAAFAGPVVDEGTKIATISGFPDDGRDSWRIDLSEFISTVSYNDLEDKPFYEETTSPAISYSLPYTDGSNPDKSYSMPFAGTTANAYLYRVGDALTASQLEGATIGTVSGTQGDDETSTVAITSNRIVNVTNGRYVLSDGMPFVFVADTDDVDIDIQDLTNFKSLDAGTYLVYIDGNNIQQGARLYSAYLSKAAVTTVHKLDAKFYDSYAPLIVTLTAGDGEITGDKTYQEVKEARLAGRPVDLVSGSTCSSVMDVSDGDVDGESVISVTFVVNNQLATATGAPSDYVGIALG